MTLHTAKKFSARTIKWIILFLAAPLLIIGCSDSDDDTKASSVTQGLNIFINEQVTGGVPLTIDVGAEVAIGPEVEYPGFAFGVYDVDATGRSLTMTLATDPNDLMVATYDANTSDLYYFEFDKEVSSASVSSAADGFSATVDVVPLGQGVTTEGAFGDLPKDFTFTNGGILVTIGEGSSLRTVGQGNSLTVDIDFK